ncbi:MAG: cytochrome c oxidase accessory protein CcoG [Alphaproteobacteria bacterium]|nr:cytochrome c oxidase accessory protein CcoG [Alphaproteobacteria bacterium]
MSNPEQITFFEAQKRIYPRDIWGRYRQLKWLAMGVLLAIYYFVPWLRWDRGPHVPDQAILIDMPARRAYFFSIEIWPQEVFYITGLLILAAVGLFFATSLLGRVWCGYACPQTVWTDLFIKVEYFFQGDKNARQKLDAAPWGLNKLWRKLATHITWLLIALCTGGAWVFYFSDAPTLADQIMHFNIPWSTASWIFGLTASTYIMAGYAREQVCTYMCPYARFQSAMFDRDTLIIGYDATRGEPRMSHKHGDSWEGRGHCVDCNMCVSVCPMGIDIRDGLQMECIACGLCVDACNQVMDKVGLPHGLVRYDTENNQLARNAARKEGKSVTERLRIIRPRTVYYTGIIAVVGCLMLYGLLTRQPFQAHVLHDRNPLFVKLSSGAIRNSYTFKILNRDHDDHDYSLQVNGLPRAEMKIEAAGQPDAAHLRVLADSVGQFRVLLSLPADALTMKRENIRFQVTDNTTGKTEAVETMFVTGE